MGIKGKPQLNKTIEDMTVGETGYVMPWALAFGEDETIYLYLGSTVDKKPCGTCSMPIERTGEGQIDYNINLDFNYLGGSYKWAVEEEPFSTVGGVNPKKIVVFEEYRLERPNLAGIFKESRETNETRNLGVGEVDQLKLCLEKAIEREDYETAAKLRDRIKSTRK
jgi:hypothetical protein